MLVQKLTLRIWTILFFAVFCSTASTAEKLNNEAKQALDVVLVMDSSGSMKYSDPHDLRKPAAKLFISLLSAGDRASVVSFSDEGYPVAYLTPVKGKTNQEKLFSSVDKISTKGVYTNLHGALEKALMVLKRNPQANRKKVIVLMSDGKMDVGNQEKATQYTEKLMQELLPQLKAKNIEVQTLAFTDGSDQELLKKIATQTNGKFKLALSDKDLHGVYTDIFEHNKQPDMIPFEGEKFKIDGSIKEVTIVGSKDSESVTLSLISPSNQVYTAKESVNHIKWSESKLFDLITITKPETGEWKIKASSGKNKAYVITDLSFKSNTDPLEPQIGEGVMIKSWLENQGKIIKQQDLRAPQTIKLHVQTPEGETHILDMEPEAVEPGQTDTGIFTSYIALPTGGRHELKMVTKTATFSRESIINLSVIQPTTQTQNIDPIEPPIQSAKAEEETKNQVNTKSAAQHTTQEKSAASHIEQPIVSAMSKPEDTTQIEHESSKKDPSVDKKHDSEDAKEKPTKKKNKSKKEKTSHEGETKKSSGMATAVYIFIGVNLLLLIIGGAIFFFIRKKGKKNSEADVDLESEENELKEAA